MTKFSLYVIEIKFPRESVLIYKNKKIFLLVQLKNNYLEKYFAFFNKGNKVNLHNKNTYEYTNKTSYWRANKLFSQIFLSFPDVWFIDDGNDYFNLHRLNPT